MDDRKLTHSPLALRTWESTLDVPCSSSGGHSSLFLHLEAQPSPVWTGALVTNVQAAGSWILLSSFRERLRSHSLESAGKLKISPESVRNVFVVLLLLFSFFGTHCAFVVHPGDLKTLSPRFGHKPRAWCNGTIGTSVCLSLQETWPRTLSLAPPPRPVSHLAKSVKIGFCLKMSVKFWAENCQMTWPSPPFTKLVKLAWWNRGLSGIAFLIDTTSSLCKGSKGSFCLQGLDRSGEGWEHSNCVLNADLSTECPGASKILLPKNVCGNLVFSRHMTSRQKTWSIRGKSDVALTALWIRCTTNKAKLSWLWRYVNLVIFCLELGEYSMQWGCPGFFFFFLWPLLDRMPRA